MSNIDKIDEMAAELKALGEISVPIHTESRFANLASMYVLAIISDWERLRDLGIHFEADNDLLVEVNKRLKSELSKAQADNQRMLLDIQGLLKKQSETRVENFRLLRDCLAGQMHSRRKYPCGCEDCKHIPTALKHIDKFIADIE